MGQAFDGDGRVLGEAFGETKREVLEQLERMHPEAEEIRIKAMRDKIAEVERAGNVTPQSEPMLQWFEYAHLPLNLQNGSKPFCDLAAKIGKEWPRNAERTVTLRKLLEAKDAAVRSLLSKA